MKAMKKSSIVGVLILMAFAVQTASASLPYSTYGAENKWAGYKDYKQDNFDARVLFNVYSVASQEFSWQGENPIPEGDKWIYAYEIINNGDQSNNTVGYFHLLDLEGNPIAQHLMHNTDSQNDGSGGIAPDSTETTGKEGEWGWSIDGGYIEAGQHSWYLVFSSDHAPTRGKFDIHAGLQQGDPGVPTPEPASIILFGSAAGWIIARRNKKQRAS